MQSLQPGTSCSAAIFSWLALSSRRRSGWRPQAAQRPRSPRYLQRLFLCPPVPCGSHRQVFFCRAVSESGCSRVAAAAADEQPRWPQQPSFQWMMPLQRGPATSGHSPATCARQTHARVAHFSSVASTSASRGDVVQICCCSQCGRRQPRVASAVTQSRPVPSDSRYERSVDGPLASGGAGIG